MSGLTHVSIPAGHRPIRGVAADVALGAALRGSRSGAVRDCDLFACSLVVADTTIRAATTLPVDAGHKRDPLASGHGPCLPIPVRGVDIHRILEWDRKTVPPDNLRISDFANLSVSVGKAGPI